MEKKNKKRQVKEIVFDENDNGSVASFRNKKGKSLSEVNALQAYKVIA